MPPRLTGKPLAGAYRTAYGQNLGRGMVISPRTEVAHRMLAVFTRPEMIRQALGTAS